MSYIHTWLSPFWFWKLPPHWLQVKWPELLMCFPIDLELVISTSASQIGQSSIILGLCKQLATGGSGMKTWMVFGKGALSAIHHTAECSPWEQPALSCGNSEEFKERHVRKKLYWEPPKVHNTRISTWWRRGALERGPVWYWWLRHLKRNSLSMSFIINKGTLKTNFGSWTRLKWKLGICYVITCSREVFPCRKSPRGMFPTPIVSV